MSENDKRQWLLEAELAYHKIVTNKKPAVLHHGDRRTEYHPGNVKELYSYIQRLKAEVGGESFRRSPARVRT